MFASWRCIYETSDITSARWGLMLLLMMVMLSDSVLLSLHQLQLPLSYANIRLLYTLLTTLRTLDHIHWLRFVVLLGGFTRVLLEAELNIRADMMLGPILVLLFARALQRTASLSDPASLEFNGMLLSLRWLIFFLFTSLVKHYWDPVNLVGSFAALYTVVIWDLSCDNVCYQWLEVKVTSLMALTRTQALHNIVSALMVTLSGLLSLAEPDLPITTGSWCSHCLETSLESFRRWHEVRIVVLVHLLLLLLLINRILLM